MNETQSSVYTENTFRRRKILTKNINRELGENYTAFSNRFIYSKDITPAAMGIYMKIDAHGGNWRFIFDELLTHVNIKKSRLLSIIKELESTNHLCRYPICVKGKFVYYDNFRSEISFSNSDKINRVDIIYKIVNSNDKNELIVSGKVTYADKHTRQLSTDEKSLYLNGIISEYKYAKSKQAEKLAEKSNVNTSKYIPTYYDDELLDFISNIDSIDTVLNKNGNKSISKIESTPLNSFKKEPVKKKDMINLPNKFIVLDESISQDNSASNSSFSESYLPQAEKPQTVNHPLINTKPLTNIDCQESFIPSVNASKFGKDISPIPSAEKKKEFVKEKNLVDKTVKSDKPDIIVGASTPDENEDSTFVNDFLKIILNNTFLYKGSKYYSDDEQQYIPTAISAITRMVSSEYTTVKKTKYFRSKIVEIMVDIDNEYISETMRRFVKGSQVKDVTNAIGYFSSILFEVASTNNISPILMANYDSENFSTCFPDEFFVDNLSARESQYSA